MIRAGGVAILLAAGRSRRMGRPKGDALLGGRRFLDHATAGIVASSLGHRIIVLGPAWQPPASDLASFHRVVHNPDPDTGQLHSLALALGEAATMAPAAPGAAILLLDNPGHVAERLGALLAAAAGAPDRVHIATHDGRRGHPLWLPASHWPGVLGYTGADGLRGYLATRPESIRDVGMPWPAVLYDLDTPQNLYDADQATPP